MTALTRDQVRDLDRRAMEQLGISSLVLMENAGRGCADLLERLEIHGPVVVACGRGNNGGDGYVIARHLHLRGHDVRVLRWDDEQRMTADCGANFRIDSRLGIQVVYVEDMARFELPKADWYVDALLGTGAVGEPKSPYSHVIQVLNTAAGRKFAVDIPSGLDCDTGQPASVTFRANVTCTLAAIKVGMLNECARPWIGELHVADIGVPVVSAAANE